MPSRCGAFVRVVAVSGAALAGGDGGPAGGKAGLRGECVAFECSLGSSAAAGDKWLPQRWRREH